MEIFLSWSGQRSKELAETLEQWLPQVIQSINPWVSSHHIDKGERWMTALASQLDRHFHGILCLTPENLDSKWIHYEAGALTKTGPSRAFTLLLGLTPAQVESPLAQFNHTGATKEEIWLLMKSINASCEHPIREEILVKAFEQNWPELDEVIQRLLKKEAPKAEAKAAKPPRDMQSMLEEILDAVRPRANESSSAFDAMSSIAKFFSEDRSPYSEQKRRAYFIAREVAAKFGVALSHRNLEGGTVNFTFSKPDAHTGGSKNIEVIISVAVPTRNGQLRKMFTNAAEKLTQ